MAAKNVKIKVKIDSEKLRKIISEKSSVRKIGEQGICSDRNHLQTLIAILQSYEITSTIGRGPKQDPFLYFYRQFHSSYYGHQYL